jgi:hypothetical protein
VVDGRRRGKDELRLTNKDRREATTIMLALIRERVLQDATLKTTVNLRLSVRQKELYEAAAEQLGVTLSEWMRTVLTVAAEGQVGRG